MSTTRRVTENVTALTAAANAGKIAKVEQVWSPQDTDADTRYLVRTNDGETKTLFHREVAGFLSGVYAADE